MHEVYGYYSSFPISVLFSLFLFIKWLIRKKIFCWIILQHFCQAHLGEWENQNYTVLFLADSNCIILELYGKRAPMCPSSPERVLKVGREWSGAWGVQVVTDPTCSSFEAHSHFFIHPPWAYLYWDILKWTGVIINKDATYMGLGWKRQLYVNENWRKMNSNRRGRRKGWIRRQNYSGSDFVSKSFALLLNSYEQISKDSSFPSATVHVLNPDH